MRRGLIAWIGRTGLALAGWKVDDALPGQAKYVLVTAPHTSNWDFPIMMLCGMALGVWPYWVGKHTLFRAPFGAIARALRGIPVDRRGAGNMVAQLTDAFAARPHMVLVMPPEGTRSWAPYWKSGFYHVARSAGVPVALSYVDYPARRAGIGPVLQLGPDLRADMDRIRAFYAGKRGRYPERQGPVRLKAEDDPVGQSGISADVPAGDAGRRDRASDDRGDGT